MQRLLTRIVTLALAVGAANFKFLKGLAVGLVVALLGWGTAFFLWRRNRKATA